MATLFSDNFNRTNEELDASADWTERGEGTGDWDIVSNECQLTVNNGQIEVAYCDASYITTADYKVSATINYNGGSNNGYMGICARRADFSTNDSDFYTALILEGTSTDTFYIFRRLSNGWQQLDSVVISPNFDTSTDYVITLTVDGDAISATLVGGTVDASLSATDTNITAAGEAGMNTGTATSGTGMSWDNFLVESLTSNPILIPVDPGGTPY